MCGINGIYEFEKSLNSSIVIKQMNEVLSHRGPDDSGIYIHDKVALGHRRLSIIDLSEAGHQPFFSYDQRYSIVFNGEIYNYQSLKKECKDYPFKTNTDTEVLVAAYIKWGMKCLEHLNGMFAFAIYDKIKKELFIARDRLGEKPLYYHVNDKYLAFSSEVRPLLKSGLVKKQLSYESLIDYLKYQTVHAPFTIVKDLLMLMPGHYITANSDSITTHKYWSPFAEENSLNNNLGNSTSYNQVCKEVKSLLYNSVESRLVADVPFGAFLSGGIDSSALVGIMSEVATAKIKTFSISFNEEKFSEAKYAKIVADKFKTEHHDIKLQPTNFLELLPEALKAVDHPSGDGMNTYVVSKVTKAAGITMALSGLGGDELFCGYDVFKRMYLLNKFKWLFYIPLFCRTVVGKAVYSAKRNIQAEKLKRVLELKEYNLSKAYPITRQLYTDNKVEEILKVDNYLFNRVAENIKEFQANANFNMQPIMSQVSCLEFNTYMQNTLLRDTDQMSMANALEVRVPFLDYHLVEYVLQIPDTLKFPSTPKKLLVDSLGNLLPADIVNRPKMGFVLPWSNWLKNELKLFVDSKISALSIREPFVREQVLNIWNQFLQGNPQINWTQIWILVVLENWLEENEF